MRSHIQGLFVLLGVGIAVLVLARIAAPVLSDAFGDEGAIVAESADVDDVVNLAAADAELEVALTGDEIAQLQADLTNLGFDPGPIDGILGNGTRAAIDAAIAEYQLDTAASDRDVLDYVTALLNAVAAAEAADNPANDLSVESQGEVESGASADG
ncbi:MAG: peptidoglycan-binding domain-containing protein [Actinomycetota bacterium]